MSDPFDPNPNPNLILSVGTQVVTLVEAKGTDGKPVHPRGAVGVVIQSPADYWHSYRVRFPDGFEASFRRPELSVLSHYKQGEMRPEHPLAEYNLYEFVIYRCIVGSRAYGLEGEDSDTDRRGVYLPPAELQWSLYGVPGQLENPDTEECYWELQARRVRERARQNASIRKPTRRRPFCGPSGREHRMVGDERSARGPGTPYRPMTPPPGPLADPTGYRRYHKRRTVNGPGCKPPGTRRGVVATMAVLGSRLHLTIIDVAADKG